MVASLQPGANFEIVPFPPERKAIDIGDYYSDFSLIRRELALRVRQHLLARKGTRFEEVRRVISPPQPIGQCARFLEERLARASRP